MKKTEKLGSHSGVRYKKWAKRTASRNRRRLKLTKVPHLGWD